MKNIKLKNLILSALFIGVGIILPFFTGQIKQIGSMLLPMHIPVFLCGLICGWQYGLAVGFFLPLIRSALFGMPYMYPNAVAMAFELSAYGFFSGFFYSHSKWKCVKALYRCLFLSMLAGRIVWGTAMLVLIGAGDKGFTLGAFAAGAFINAFPGIILQFIFIPAVMIALNRAKLVSFRKNNKTA